MAKTIFKPGTMLNPVPVVMVSCGKGAEKNIITVAWVGIINSEPPMTYVSVRRERWSHRLIEESGEFVINLVTKELAAAADYCGVRSGRDVDKFRERKLTAVSSRKVKCPSIAESPVNIECRVVEKHSYPSHEMFVAEIVSVSAETSLMDERGRLCLDEAGLIAYNHGEYFGLERKPLGRFGYSVMKPKTRRRLAAQGKGPRGAKRNKNNSTGRSGRNR